MKKAKKVTRIAYADDLNQAKYDALDKIAFEAKVFAVLMRKLLPRKHCGSIRTEVWRNYGSVGGLGAKFRPVRDGWIADKHVSILPQRIWRATLSDTLDDVKASLEAAKEKVVRHIFRNLDDKDKRKDLFQKLKNDSVWVKDSYLRRLMRKSV